MWYERRWFYPRSQPRQAKGGIKAQSKRGSFGESWWAKRWIDVLHGFDIGARLDRGRSYARRGQVLSIDVAEGVVKAKVQGSQPRPYSVSIQVTELTAGDWKKVAKAFGEQALFAAKLLAGEMPQEIEQVFKQVDLSLFPKRSGDLKTDCSCPDWSNPCKHVAAVYYLLGEEFDRDPFLLFKLRGLSREKLLALLGSAGKAAAKAPTAAEPAAAAEPLADEAAAFWGGKEVPADLPGEVRVPPVAAALPRQLGSFPFWRGQEKFLEAIEPVYGCASEHGLDVFLGRGGEAG